MSLIHLGPGADLQAALDAAAPGSTLHLSPGVYRQKTRVRVPDLTLEGEGPDCTLLVYDDYAEKIHADGKPYNTFRTWTMAVLADGVTLRNLSIVNDAGSPETRGQQVALGVLGDRFLMEHCRLSSTQDTLFCGPLPADLIERYVGFLDDELRVAGPFTQIFRDCLIEGTVDYIFGCGDALFENCELRSVYDVRGCGYIAAPAHPLEDTQGFHFLRCRITADSRVRPESIFLARPWRDYGLARFEDCSCGPHIQPEGFDKWGDTSRDQTARFFEAPAVSGRVPWINRQTRS